MPKVSLVNDDRVLPPRLKTDLADLGFKADIFDSVEALAADGDTDVDLLIVGCRPGGCRDRIATLKEAWQTQETPILLIVDTEAVDALDVGDQVDDIILTDYNLKELSARLKLLMARAPKAAKDDETAIGGLVIDFRSFEVRVDDRIVPLTFREYELLRFLAADRGRVFTRKLLVEQIWEYDYLSGTRTVDVHIRRLRYKLGPRYGSMIETVRNVGYRFSRHDPPGPLPSA